jgi:hypothetical protein
MKSSLNFLLLSERKDVLDRTSELSREFEYHLRSLSGVGPLLAKDTEFDHAQFILLDATRPTKEDLAELVRAIRGVAKEAFLCVMMEEKTTDEGAELVKKAGASLVMTEAEFLNTSRLEFVASQIIRGSYVPVKLSEFPKASVLDFTLYHLMPLNQKLLPVLPKGSPLSEGRLKKLEGVSEVYIRRDEIDRYRLYVEAHPELVELGLRARCRAQYLSFCNSHSQLVFLLSTRSEQAASKEGKWLYDRCEILARELLTTLSSLSDAWDVVNNSSLGEFGSVERSPTIAAYAGLLSLLASIGEPVEVMTAGLLADVGMLELPPAITRKLRQGHSAAALDDAERLEYQKHPILSLNQVQSRNIQLKENIKSMILCSHEKNDGTGFPNQVRGENLPQEAMLIQFSEMIDQGAMGRRGQPRRSVKEVRQQLMELEMNGSPTFSFELLQKLKPVV